MFTAPQHPQHPQHAQPMQKGSSQGTVEGCGPEVSSGPEHSPSWTEGEAREERLVGKPGAQPQAASAPCSHCGAPSALLARL